MGFEPRAFPEEGSPAGRRWQGCAQGPGTCGTPGLCPRSAGTEQLPEPAGRLALGSHLPASCRAGAGATAEPHSVPLHGTTRVCFCTLESNRALSCYPACLSWKRNCQSKELHTSPARGGGEANSIFSLSFQGLGNKLWICWVVAFCSFFQSHPDDRTRNTFNMGFRCS